MEVWWLFTNLMRYPRQIYDSEWALPIRMVFGFIIPAFTVSTTGGTLSEADVTPQVLQDLKMHLLLAVNRTELLERYRYISISIAVVAVVAASIDRL